MKPSERIKEIFKKNEKCNFFYTGEVNAIIQYLDELHEQQKTQEQRQYDAFFEKQKPCEHKNITDDLVCEDCGEAKR